MRWLNQVLVLYSAIMIVMAVEAYIRVRSMPSLIAGCAVGLLMLGTVALSLTNPRPARISAAVLSLVVLVWFTRGYVENQNFYPAGLIAILSFIVFGCLIAGHFMGMLARRERGRETLPAAFAEKQAREREESVAPRSEPKV